VARIRLSKPAGINPEKFGVRAATGAIYAGVVLGAIWFNKMPGLTHYGPLLLGGVTATFAGFSAAEFYAIERRESRLPNEIFGVAAAIMMPLAAALWGLGGLSAIVTGLIAFSLV